MKLFEKLISIYPQLSVDDFDFLTGSIHLQNDSDGRGDYIAKWENMALPCPTDEELEAA